MRNTLRIVRIEIPNQQVYVMEGVRADLSGLLGAVPAGTYASRARFDGAFMDYPTWYLRLL